jgi:hypothetical protein
MWDAWHMFWIAAYLSSVVIINLAFSWLPNYSVIWSAWIGIVFILRDMVQTRVGHYALLPMLVAVLLSWIIGDPFVAVASATAFAVSETVDWIVFTITKRPLHHRIWISSFFSIPLDTAIFCLMLNLSDPFVWASAILSKMAAVSLICAALSFRERPA